MIKYIINTIRFLLIICAIIVVANVSTNVYEQKIENDNTNNTINLSTMALKVEEINKSLKYSAKDTFTGSLTGYAANCPLCGGRLACKSDYYVLDGRTTYNDPDYGEVRIVASSLNLPCGTVVSFDSPKVSNDTVVAIVLDRGVLGNALDLLVPSEKYASDYIGRSTITYDVLRSGWGM